MCRSIAIIGVFLSLIEGTLGDEITRKDGSVFKGEIIEHRLGEYYKMRLRDGSVILIKEEEVETIRFEPPLPRKSRELACCFSCLVPGLGQVYNQEYIKGAIFLGGSLICLALMIADSPRYEDGRVVKKAGPVYYVASAAGMAITLWSMIDAWQGAERINRARGYGRALFNFEDGRWAVRPSGPGVSLKGGHASIGVNLVQIEF